jgi:hypothetical protein
MGAAQMAPWILSVDMPGNFSTGKASEIPVKQTLSRVVFNGVQGKFSDGSILMTCCYLVLWRWLDAISAIIQWKIGWWLAALKSTKMARCFGIGLACQGALWDAM